MLNQTTKACLVNVHLCVRLTALGPTPSICGLVYRDLPSHHLDMRPGTLSPTIHLLQDREHEGT